MTVAYRFGPLHGDLEVRILRSAQNDVGETDSSTSLRMTGTVAHNVRRYTRLEKRILRLRSDCQGGTGWRKAGFGFDHSFDYFAEI